LSNKRIQERCKAEQQPTGLPGTHFQFDFDQGRDLTTSQGRHKKYWMTAKGRHHPVAVLEIN
jgi:hypothetical protein